MSDEKIRTQPPLEGSVVSRNPNPKEMLPEGTVKVEAGPRKCSVDGCMNTRDSRGLCGMHYMQLKRKAGTLPPIPRSRSGENHYKWKGGININNHPLYVTWMGMKQRCINPKSDGYKYYGGRGITVCERWMESFQLFVSDMGPRPSPKHSIDRINNNGNYEPSNCRWATSKEQNRNLRVNTMLTFKSRTITLLAWADETGIHQDTIYSRLKLGWPIERVLTEKTRAHNRKKQEFINYQASKTAPSLKELKA